MVLSIELQTDTQMAIGTFIKENPQAPEVEVQAAIALYVKQFRDAVRVHPPLSPTPHALCVPFVRTTKRRRNGGRMTEKVLG